MSSIRHRKRGSKEAIPESSNMTPKNYTSETVSRDEITVSGLQPTNTVFRPHHGKPRSVFTLLLVVLGSSLLALVLTKSRSNVTPKSYAICSKEGRIYTVDETKPSVECIVVHYNRILATGSLGIL